MIHLLGKGLIQKGLAWNVGPPGAPSIRELAAKLCEATNNKEQKKRINFIGFS
jgi:nucleoside-diphosphate-sugar epimerase